MEIAGTKSAVGRRARWGEERGGAKSAIWKSRVRRARWGEERDMEIADTKGAVGRRARPLLLKALIKGIFADLQRLITRRPNPSAVPPLHHWREGGAGRGNRLIIVRVGKFNE